MGYCFNPKDNSTISFGDNPDPKAACLQYGFQWGEFTPESEPKGKLDDIIKTVTDDKNDLDKLSFSTGDGDVSITNKRAKDSVATNKVMGGECILPEGAEWDHVCHPDHDEYKAAMAQKKDPNTTFNIGGLTKAETYKPIVDSVIPKSVTSTLKDEDSPVSDFLWGSAKDAAKGGMDALGDRAARWLGLTEGDYDDVDSTSQIPTNGVQNIQGAPQGDQQGARKGYIEAGELPAGTLPSIDPLATVGPTENPYVGDSQFVDTMDGQLTDQGYMGPQLDQQGQQGQMSALEGAPQYNIEGLPTLHQEGGQFIDHKPEDVIAGAQGALPMDKPYTQENRIGQHAPYDPNSPFPGQGEFNSGFNEGSFDSRDFHIPALAELGGMGERAYEDASNAVESAIQGIEQALIGTGLIDDPQAIEAVNTFVQEVDKLAEEQQTEEVTDDDLDTLMMQAEFDAEMLDEEYDSRVQRLPDRWAPKDEESTLDSITSFLGGLLADFTKLTGITSQELMRALVMYAGSRLFGYSAHDSAQFAFKNFANGVQDNWTAQMKDHDYYKKEQSKILDKYNGNKEDPGYQTEIAALDRTVANNNMTYAEKVLLKQAESKIKVDASEVIEEDKKVNLIEGKQAGSDITGTAKLQADATADAETGFMQRTRNTQLRQMLADGSIETGAWTGNLMQAARSFLTDTIGVKELESATGEVLYNYTVNEVLKFISQTKGAISEKEMKVFAEAALGRMKSSLGLKVLLETSDKIVRFQIKYDEALSNFVSDWKKKPDNKAKQAPAPEEVRKWQHQWNKDNELVLPTAKLLQNAEGGEAMQNAINATSSIAQINELFGGRKPTREEQEMVIARVKKAKAADGDWDGTSISTNAPAY